MQSRTKTNAQSLLQFRHLILKHQLKTERLKSHTITDEMLAHRLHPMQPQTVQHGARTLHDHQHSNSEEEPDGEENKDRDHAGSAFHAESVGEGHGPEDDGELLVGEGEGPETEVGGGVGDAVEAEFWG